MPPVSPLTTVAFCAVVLVVLAIVAFGLRRAGTAAPWVVTLVVAYLVLPGLLARAGVLDRYNPLPAPALALILALSLLTVTLALMSPGAAVAARTPVAAIVLLQSFRIAVEWLLHRLFLEGVVPVQMTFAGRNLDILSGLTGLLLGGWLLSGRSAPRWVLLGWNLMGLGLLVNIIAIAVLSTPAPFRQFLEGPPNLLPSTLPFVWLPSFLVQVALASHLLIFRSLRPAPRQAG